MNPQYSFEGQVALVTGAASGMGLATARAFARSGAAVVLADVDKDAVDKAAKELTDAGHQALGVVCDVTDEAQAAAAVDRAVDAYGRLDMAFNNAGIQAPPTDAADESAENFDRVNAVNLRGVWAAQKHELRHMRTQGSGAIVNCSSLGGLVGLPERAADLRLDPDSVTALDTASDPDPAPYPYGPFGSAQRDRTANDPEALGALIDQHAESGGAGQH
ncbi:SDR family NAD(P)-dependent oxidoreductase [Streptomyces sp. NPDC003300]|uniref:SDR family NAD(P)-dependent oxidoreductase n=1 Tax=unclassified Streptomyces TaxID=2593676 RepID=UPI0033ACCD16